MPEDKTRALLVRIKGLLMLAVDLIDRECQLGKYAVPLAVSIGARDSIAGAYQMPEEKEHDKLPSV